VRVTGVFDMLQKRRLQKALTRKFSLLKVIGAHKHRFNFAALDRLSEKLSVIEKQIINQSNN
jgi:hypothetical protein